MRPAGCMLQTPHYRIWDNLSKGVRLFEKSHPVFQAQDASHGIVNAFHADATLFYQFFE